MGRGRRVCVVGRGRRARLMGAAVVCALLPVAGATHAGTITPYGEVAPRGDWQLAIGPMAGALGLDRDLADYRWDTRPALQAGAHATLYRGRFGAGLRFWRARTTQASGIPGESQAPRVNLTGIELVGQVRFVTYAGVELWGSAHGGRLHLGYDPDQLTFDLGLTSGPVTVDYEPISEWDLGLGLELRGELTTHMALSLQAESSTFALDTSHRRGDEIVQSRERFYGWSLRLQVSWLLSLG